MRKLVKGIDSFRPEIKRVVGERLKEFKAVKRSGSELFKELSFCLLTANFNAERSILIQEELGEGFLSLPESRLKKKLAGLGHRFPNARARYIVEARRVLPALEELIRREKDQGLLRDWLAGNVKGLGYKEASHFLRNIGFNDLAIIDFHIVDLLVRQGLIEKPKNLSKARYLEIEGLLRGIAGKAGMSLAELDLYLWYMETGKVLK